VFAHEESVSTGGARDKQKERRSHSAFSRDNAEVGADPFPGDPVMSRYGDEDYGDRLEQRPDRRPNSNRTLWIVLGVAGGGGLLVLMACAGLIGYSPWMANESIEPLGVARATADMFLAQLQSNAITKSSYTTSQNSQATNTRKQFTQFVATHPTTTKHTRRTETSHTMFQVNGVTRVRVQYSLTGPNNATTCTLVLIEENGAWVVDSFTVP
jgi:hypothetical protein